jgi:hypothetical protein
MTDDERREKTRLRVAVWRKKNAARLAAERAEKRINQGSKLNTGRERYRLVELVSAQNVPVLCLVVRDGEQPKIPAGLRPAHVFAIRSLLTYSEAHSFRRIWHANFGIPLPKGGRPRRNPPVA